MGTYLVACLAVRRTPACFASADQQVARDEPPDQQGADRGRGLLDALALVRRELFDLGDRQAEFGADLRHQPR